MLEGHGRHMGQNVVLPVEELQSDGVSYFLGAREGVGAECTAHAKVDAYHHGVGVGGVVGGGEKVKEVFAMGLDAGEDLVVDGCCTWWGVGGGVAATWKRGTARIAHTFDKAFVGGGGLKSLVEQCFAVCVGYTMHLMAFHHADLKMCEARWAGEHTMLEHKPLRVPQPIAVSINDECGPFYVRT